MNEVITVYRRYVQFEGRSGRREYWIYFLFYVVACAVLAIIDNMIFGASRSITSGAGWSMSGGFQPLTSIFAVVSLVPGIAVTVRRLHDTGKSGWWALVGLIPLIGWIWVLFLCAAKSEPGANAYGDGPLPVSR